MTLDATEFVQLAVELAFVGFALTVLLCILRQMRLGNVAFLTSFFVTFVLQSVSDIVEYACVGEIVNTTTQRFIGYARLPSHA